MPTVFSAPVTRQCLPMMLFFVRLQPREDDDEPELIAAFEDLRERLAENEIVVDYFVDAVYNAAAERLFLIAGTHEGNVELLHVNLDSIERAASLYGGHSATVRSVYWDSVNSGTIISGAEDAKLCMWADTHVVRNPHLSNHSFALTCTRSPGGIRPICSRRKNADCRRRWCAGRRDSNKAATSSLLTKSVPTAAPECLTKRTTLGFCFQALKSQACLSLLSPSAACRQSVHVIPHVMQPHISLSLTLPFGTRDKPLIPLDTAVRCCHSA